MAPRPQAVLVEGPPAPTGPFPHATVVGDLVFTSGQAGRDRVTGEMGDAAAQVAQALQNLDDILHGAGSCLQEAVKVTLFLRDDVTADDMKAVNAAYAEGFPERRPSRSSVFVSRLKNPDMLVEIEVVAVVR